MTKMSDIFIKDRGDIVKDKDKINEEVIEEDGIEEIDTEIEDLKNLIEEKDKENEEIKNSLLRLQADFTNYKNRVEKEKFETIKYASEKIMGEILPVLDNFERALDSMDSDNSYFEGVELIYKQLLDVLSGNGLVEIEALGEIFDPNIHHAVIMEESEDQESETVKEVLQKGYTLNEKVIRPSMVKVVK